MRLLILDSDPQKKQLYEEFNKVGLKDNEISAKLHTERFQFDGWRDNANSQNRLNDIISEQLGKMP